VPLKIALFPDLFVRVEIKMLTYFIYAALLFPLFLDLGKKYLIFRSTI